MELEFVVVTSERANNKDQKYSTGTKKKYSRLLVMFLKRKSQKNQVPELVILKFYEQNSNQNRWKFKVRKQTHFELKM